MTGVKRPVVLASDHAGVALKRRLRDELAAWGEEVEDLGTDGEESVDYPDFAEAVAVRVSEGRARLGVLVCGTGIGMTISANKVPAVRAALLYDDFSARYARLHNDANIAVFGARTTSADDAVARLKIFLGGTFESGRHARRIEKIGLIEKRRGSHAGKGA